MVWKLKHCTNMRGKRFGTQVKIGHPESNERVMSPLSLYRHAMLYHIPVV